jgi:hypothetical protein
MKFMLLSMLILVLLAGALLAQAISPIRPGQPARILRDGKWLTGVLESAPAVPPGKPGARSCLAINLESSGLPGALMIKATDSLEVWVTTPPPRTYWMGVPIADRQKLACS